MSKTFFAEEILQENVTLSWENQMPMHLVSRTEIERFENYWSACPDDLLNRPWSPTAEVLVHQDKTGLTTYIADTFPSTANAVSTLGHTLTTSAPYTVHEGMSAPPRMTHMVLKTRSVLPKRWACQLSVLWGLFSTLISRMRVLNPLSSAFLWRPLPRLMFSVLHITLSMEMMSGLQKDSPVPRDDRVKELDVMWRLYRCCQVQGCWQLIQGRKRSAWTH